MQITSAQNSRIKLVQRLRGKRGRQDEARFVIDYERDLARALKMDYAIDFILHEPRFDAQTRYPAVDARQVPPALLRRVGYRENPDGMVAVLHSKPNKRMAQLREAAIDSVIVLVALDVPGNIGALLRTADAAGMDAIILVECAIDLYNPNIIRSSTGACFLDKIFFLDGGEALAWLKAERFQVVAADVAGARSLYSLDFCPKTAIVLGAEDRGLPPRWIEAADEIVRIPMAGVLSDSLNVSVSGAIMMYEQRRQSHRGGAFGDRST